MSSHTLQNEGSSGPLPLAAGRATGPRRRSAAHRHQYPAAGPAPVQPRPGPPPLAGAVLNLTGALTLLALTLLLAAPAAQAQTRPGAKPAPAKTSPRPAPKTGAKTTPKTTLKTTPAPSVAPQPASATRSPQPAPRNPQPAPRNPAGGLFEVGTTALNLGIGLGNRYGFGTGVGLLGGSSSVSPALSLSAERGVAVLGPGVVGVGGFVGYQGASYDFGGGDRWRYTDLIVTARAAFHYPVAAAFDAYAGLGLGLRYTRVAVDGGGLFGTVPASGAELASGLFVGGRYFFTDTIGAFAELGYDQSYLKAGLTARF